MIVMRYTVACDRCRRAVPNLLGTLGVTAAPWFETGRAARAHARWCKWLRIPRGDARDVSRRQRGMDICTDCVKDSDRRARDDKKITKE